MSDSYDDYEAKMQLAEQAWEKRVDEMVKTEHDKQITIAQAYERGWNAALAQQEPVAIVFDPYDAHGLQWLCQHPPKRGDKLYTAPPKREWVGLTALEIYECWKTGDVVEAVEVKLKEKNT